MRQPVTLHREACRIAARLTLISLDLCPRVQRAARGAVVADYPERLRALIMAQQGVLAERAG